MPLCVKGTTPKHADWCVPMPPKEKMFRPNPTFSMSGARGARVDEEATRLALERSSLSVSSLLTGLRDDEDLVAARHQMNVLMDAEQEWLSKTVPAATPGGLFGQLLLAQLDPEDSNHLIDGQLGLPGQLLVQPLPGFPDLRFQHMSEDEALSMENETLPIWARPTKFTLRSESGVVWYLFGNNSNEMRVGIPGEELTDKKKTREILVETFVRASQDRDSLRAANTLALLRIPAQEAAYTTGQHARFAEAFSSYLQAVRALSFPTVSHDIVAYSVVCGSAFEQASARDDVSADKAQQLRGKAVMAYKQALLRVGNLPMATYAFH